MFSTRGRTRPTMSDLIEAKDHDAIAKRGPLGVGALRSMASKGDRDARATLRKLREDVADDQGDLS